MNNQGDMYANGLTAPPGGTKAHIYKSHPGDMCTGEAQDGKPDLIPDNPLQTVQDKLAPDTPADQDSSSGDVPSNPLQAVQNAANDVISTGG